MRSRHQTSDAAAIRPLTENEQAHTLNLAVRLVWARSELPVPWISHWSGAWGVHMVYSKPRR